MPGNFERSYLLTPWCLTGMNDSESDNTLLGLGDPPKESPDPSDSKLYNLSPMHRYRNSQPQGFAETNHDEPLSRSFTTPFFPKPSTELEPSREKRTPAACIGLAQGAIHIVKRYYQGSLQDTLRVNYGDQDFGAQ